MLQQVNDTTKLLRPIEVPSKPKRIISQTTGLAKFNITQRINENDKVNKEFSKLEQAARLRPSKSGLNLKHHGHTIVYSPHTSPIRENKSGEDHLHQLASKQREVLEYKQQLEELKRKIELAENEVLELQTLVNNDQINSSPQVKNPFDSPPQKSLTKATSISHLRVAALANNTQTRNGFSNLKKKLSMQQIQTKQSISKFNNDNFKIDANQLIEKGLNLMNTIKMEFKQQTTSSSELAIKYRYNDSSDDFDSDSDDDDSDVSNYGSADTSDYALPVK